MNDGKTICRGRCPRLLDISGKIEGATMPCSEKCNCYLTRALIRLKNKIADQSKVLNGFATSKDEPRCNVELTPSEEKLFGAGNVKDDSMVCCILVRELRAQKRDLDEMMSRWLEFTDKADRFAHVTSELRDKLAELTPRIESILHETKVLEVIELENEETRRREIDEELRRSSERREIFREAVDSFDEAETRHHLEQLARREKLDELDRDRSMDRAALKLALARMMRAVGPTSGSNKKTEISGASSIPKAPSKINDKSALRPPAKEANLAHGDIKVLPGQPENHNGTTEENMNSLRRRGGNVCPGKLCERTIAGRQF